jgi:hypothetical protein
MGLNSSLLVSRCSSHHYLVPSASEKGMGSGVRRISRKGTYVTSRPAFATITVDPPGWCLWKSVTLTSVLVPFQLRSRISKGRDLDSLINLPIYYYPSIMR